MRQAEETARSRPGREGSRSRRGEDEKRRDEEPGRPAGEREDSRSQ